MLKAVLLRLSPTKPRFVMQLKIGEWLRRYLDRTLADNETTTMSYPPPIAAG
jgi:hypothetical protein